MSSIQADEALPAVRETAGTPLDVSVKSFKDGLDRRKVNRAALMEWVGAALVEGTDYGRIKVGGKTSKPSLWKPGAEKICGMLGVTVHFPTMPDYEQAVIHGVDLKQILLRCEIHDAFGNKVAEGAGARALSKDSGDLNKALKMAAKSAHIDATLRMAGLSEVFTQDLEDMTPSSVGHDEGEDRRPVEDDRPALIACPGCGQDGIIRSKYPRKGESILGWYCLKCKQNFKFEEVTARPWDAADKKEAEAELLDAQNTPAPNATTIEEKVKNVFTKVADPKGQSKAAAALNKKLGEPSKDDEAEARDLF